MAAEGRDGAVWRMRTGSRLHFGFLALPGEGADTPAGLPERCWGGAGLMIRRPGFVLEARPAPEWSADGPLAGRVMGFVRPFLAALGEEQHDVCHPSPLRFTVVQEVPEHQGLGTGTQLALATARILVEAHALPEKSAVCLARRVGRGRRSAVGIHGFDHGGFVVEGGKRRGEEVSPLVARVDFPPLWRMVLVFPDGMQGLHGADELRAFGRLTRGGAAALPTERACRLALFDMLPALVELDLAAFGEALHEFNRLSGEAFAPVQGGVYAHPRGEEIAAFLRRRGVRGVGQSSWGPALFAVCGDDAEAEALRKKLCDRFAFAAGEVQTAEPLNAGASVEVG